MTDRDEELSDLRERLNRSDDDCRAAIGMIGDIVAEFVRAGRPTMALPPAIAVRHLLAEIDKLSTLAVRPGASTIIAHGYEFDTESLPWAMISERAPIGDTGDADTLYVIRDRHGREIFHIPENVVRVGPQVIDVAERLGQIVIEAVNTAFGRTPPMVAWLEDVMARTILVVPPDGFNPSTPRQDGMHWLHAEGPEQFFGVGGALVLDPDDRLSPAQLAAWTARRSVVLTGIVARRFIACFQQTPAGKVVSTAKPAK